MGNQSSKPAGNQVPTSPGASHSSNSSTANPRKELTPQPSNRSHHSNPSNQQKASSVDTHSTSTNSTSSQVFKADETTSNGEARQRAHEIYKKDREKSKHSKSTPVKVPRGSDPRRQRGPDSQFEPSGPPRDLDYVPHSNLNFPPRLPLPIEEEIHAPGSPVIAPEGFSSSLNEDDIDGPLPRQSSTVSSTTIAEDAAGDELQPYPYEQPPGGTVPTKLQWTQAGERVYVTGTFAAGWSKKFRLNRE